MPEIDPDALRQTGRPSVRWSDIVHALATIAGAATHAHLETALHCACQDIVGAKEAFLLFPAEAGLPATKAHGEGMTGAAPSVTIRLPHRICRHAPVPRAPERVSVPDAQQHEKHGLLPDRGTAVPGDAPDLLE